MKGCVFSGKIEIVREIIAKMYSHQERIGSNGPHACLLGSKKEESVRCVEAVMRGMA